MYLLTYHGTLVGMDPSGHLIQRDARAIGSIEDIDEIPITLELDEIRFHRRLRLSPRPWADVVVSGALAGHVVHHFPEHRAVALSNNGLFYCAIPGEPEVTNNRTEVNDWERFACLSREDAQNLLFILGHDWVLGSTSAIIRSGTIELAQAYGLRVGPIHVDLRYNLPFPTVSDQARDPLFSALLLIDGWKIEALSLFKPMIYLTAFKTAKHLPQAAIAIASLVEFGHYEGAIHLISDYARHEVLSAIPLVGPDRVTVQPVDAADQVGQVAAKYSILDWEAARSHQPLLFIDVDTMADNILDPLLSAIARSARIMAPIEQFSPLAQSPSVGATLIQRAGYHPRYACGFNTGVLGIPNIRDHERSLRLVRTILINSIDTLGRAEFPWVDQEIANYVAFKSGGVDTGGLSHFFRFAWQGAELRADQRFGLANFFPPRGPISKADAMATYARTLRAAIDAR